MEYYNETLLKHLVHFAVNGRPQYGEVIVQGPSGPQPRRQFTLDDLESGHVSYQHDGTETSIDSMDIEVTFSREALNGQKAQRLDKLVCFE